MVFGHVALGQHDVVVPDPSHADLSFVKAEILGVSTFLGQRQDQHEITLSKNALLVHSGRRAIADFRVGSVCGGMGRSQCWPQSTTTQMEGVTMHIPRVAALAGMLTVATSFVGRASGDQPKPKYYFTISNITSEDNTIIPLAKDLLAKEISARSEFTQDLGGAEGEAAAFAEMKKRGLRGFQVNLRIMNFKQEIKPPAPGRRDRQMAIQVKLGVYGTTYPGGKLNFTGDGEASLTGDFSERRMESDVENLRKTALASALKQAVSVAVDKMSTATLPDSPRRKKHKAK
jgi:hypothetical protein